MNPFLSIVFITYNRSELLIRTFTALEKALKRLDLAHEIIIADDCSEPSHIEAIRELASAKVVQTERNLGLGANANSGLRSCRGRFILQIQDDWEFVGTEGVLTHALRILQSDPSIGIVQMTPVHSDLAAEGREIASGKFKVFRNDGLPWNRSCGVRPYSDCPHLKRSEFIKELGPYLEDVPMGLCENDFKRRVATQIKWKVAALEEVDAFSHLGAEASLNPGGRRNPWVALILSIPYAGVAAERTVRRMAKFIDHACAVAWSKAPWR